MKSFPCTLHGLFVFMPLYGWLTQRLTQCWGDVTGIWFDSAMCLRWNLFFFFFSFVHICIQMADLIFVFICSYTYRERLCETNDTQKWIHGIILITMAVELIGAQSVITSECLRGNLGNHSLCNIDSAVRVLNLIW